MKRSAAARAITVALHWGDDRIAVRCLGDGERFTYGEGKGLWSALPIADEIPWGSTLVRANRGGATVSVPKGSIVLVRRPCGKFSIVHGPNDTWLTPGDQATFKAGAMTLIVSADAPVEAPKGRSKQRSVTLPIVSAALAHGLVMGLAAQASAARALSDPADDQLDAARELLIAAEERVKDNPPPTWGDVMGKGRGKEETDRAGDRRVVSGGHAKGRSGAMGDESARRDKRGRYTVQEHHKGDKERSLSRDEALREARSFGVIGLLPQDNTGSAVSSVWGKPEAHGADALRVNGGMWGDRADAHVGSHGLGLTGIGEGGGGLGEGIGLHGRSGLLGSAPLAGGAWENRWNSGGGGYRVSYGRHMYLRDRCGPFDTIQSNLCRSKDRFNKCYWEGRKRDPSLAGKVVINFVIGRSGKVVYAELGPSDLPDKTVTACMVRVTYYIRFPESPANQTISHPLSFAPPIFAAPPL